MLTWEDVMGDDIAMNQLADHHNGHKHFESSPFLRHESSLQQLAWDYESMTEEQFYVVAKGEYWQYKANTVLIFSF
mgnify:CR=1 FL=1